MTDAVTTVVLFLFVCGSSSFHQCFNPRTNFMMRYMCSQDHSAACNRQLPVCYGLRAVVLLAGESHRTGRGLRLLKFII